jgi:hypothetical protein
MIPSRCVVGVFLLLASRAGAGTIEIEHRGASCIVAERHAQVSACVTAPAGLARVRAHFRATGSAPWHSVDMKADTGCWVGVLPPPLASTSGVEYYVEAIDQSFNTVRTERIPLRVASVCVHGVALPSVVPAASVVVTAPMGGPAIPDGFQGGRPMVAAQTAPPAATAAPPQEDSEGGARGLLLAGVALAGAGAGALIASASSDDGVNAPANVGVQVVPPGVAIAAATLVSFAATSSGEGVSYRWSFGDGASATGAAVTHTYAAEGVYGVTVTATSSGGSSAAVATVTVRSLTGNWDYALSNGWGSPLPLSQNGTTVSGTGDGFVFTGALAHPRELSFIIDAPDCRESGRLVADDSGNVFQGTLLACSGPTLAITMTRR